MDEVEFEPTPRGTCVRLVKRFPEPFSERAGGVKADVRPDRGGCLSRLQPVGYAESA